jgi:hypothetical protein
MLTNNSFSDPGAADACRLASEIRNLQLGIHTKGDLAEDESIRN